MLWFMRPEFDRYARYMSNGSAREVFDWDCMCGVELPVPPIDEQHKIVHDYKVISDRINILKKASEKLEAIINCFFIQTFFTNTQDEDLLEFEFGKYRPTSILSKTSEVVDVRDGTHDSPKAVLNGHKLITSIHLNPYSVNKEEAYAISDHDYYEINKRSCVNTGDILMSMIGTVGRLSWVTDASVDYAIKNVALFKASALSVEMRLYLLTYLKSDVVKKYLASFLAGSTQSYVSLSTLRSMPLVIPIETEIQQFADAVAPMYTLLVKYEQEIHCLEKIGSSLYCPSV